jgi:hypothetical protein
VLRASILEPLAVMVLDKRIAEYTNCQPWRSLQDGLRLWIGQEHGLLPSASRYQLHTRLHGWQNMDSLRLSFLTAYDTAYDTSGCCGWPNDWQYHHGASTLRTEAAWTLVSYAMDSYGFSALPSLIEAMGEHNTWEGLIPAVFGVSAEEFEQGWQAYLDSEYQ